MVKQNGQVVLILLLLVAVGLGVGISIIQRSISDISTSTKVEQSSRAFSAAEAGIEKALHGDSSGVSANALGNQSSATVVDSGLLPAVNQPFESPQLAKEEIAEVWLADPNSLTEYYNPPTLDLDIYWGDPTDAGSSQPAIDVNVISYSAGNYLSQKFFFDPNATTHGNGFQSPTNTSPYFFNCSSSLPAITTSVGSNRRFYCKATLPSLARTMILVRARLLYNNSSRALAVVPKGGCGSACSIPPQQRIITSTGVSGETQRVVQVVKTDKIVPFYFDYAIFSMGEITK